MREEHAVFIQASDGVHEAVLRTYYPEEVEKAFVHVMNWTVRNIRVISRDETKKRIPP